MVRLLPPSAESPGERHAACVGVLLLHALFVWWVAQMASHGITGAGDRVQGDGEAMVVEFIAISKSDTAPQRFSISMSEQTKAPRTEDAHSKTTPTSSEATNDVRRTLGETGDFTARKPAPVRPQASEQVSKRRAVSIAMTAAVKGGSPADDLLASYQAALRARIAKTWRDMTQRDLPGDCPLHLSQTPGGALVASSAASCELSRTEQLQLESAALMSQPLPYAGYETVFQRELDLVL